MESKVPKNYQRGRLELGGRGRRKAEGGRERVEEKGMDE